ncbi:MAG: 50S ribosomal protein L24 [Pseudomonadota bacterium]|nr:50S ribosomal protein L24 [Pseudomonadota bacterium]
MERIKKGDEIIVISGRDKGRRGTILSVQDDRLLVEGINIVKKHQKANPNSGAAGGILEQERSIDRSNVMIYNPITEKGDRVGVRTLEDGKKVRFFKSNNEVIDV